MSPHGADVGIEPTHPDYQRFNLGGVYYSMLTAPGKDEVVAVPLRWVSYQAVTA